MDAVISGRTGRALLLDNGSLMSFDVDDPDTLVPRRQADLHFLFGEARDLRTIENCDRNQIARELELAYNCSSSLDLALISLDAELSDEIRMEALEVLNGLLSDRRVTAHLESILYARPLPVGGDIAILKKLRDRVRLQNASALLRKLERCQPLICEVSEAWDTIPLSSFGGYEQQAECQRIAVRMGVFRSLVSSLYVQEIYTTSLMNGVLDRPTTTSRTREMRRRDIGVVLLNAIGHSAPGQRGPNTTSPAEFKSPLGVTEEDEFGMLRSVLRGMATGDADLRRALIRVFGSIDREVSFREIFENLRQENRKKA